MPSIAPGSSIRQIDPSEEESARAECRGHAEPARWVESLEHTDKIGRSERSRPGQSGAEAQECRGTKVRARGLAADEEP